MLRVDQLSLVISLRISNFLLSDVPFTISHKLNQGHYQKLLLSKY